MATQNMHSLISYRLLPVLVTIVLLQALILVHSKTLESDIAVLRLLKESVDPISIPTYSYLNSWDFSSDPCDSEATGGFQGILCTFPMDNSDNRILSIDLDSASYDGFLTPSIGNLTELTLLSIGKNNFRGPIPETIANLRKLHRLSLSQNFFTGGIPRGISNLKHLQILDLSQNHLSGSISANITILRGLTQLILSNNAFSGKIPNLSGLWQLNTLDLSHNSLDGIVSNLPTNLRKLFLSHNLLSGHITPTGVLQRLRQLDLSVNRFTGRIRQEVLTLPQVIRINVSVNQFTTIDAIEYPRRVSQLRELDAHANRLHGRLPIGLVTMANLISIDLSYNEFNGQIPVEYGVKLRSSWKRLFLENNFLIGNLPPQFINGTASTVKGSLAHNCLRCPLTCRMCRGRQRPNSECVREEDVGR